MKTAFQQPKQPQFWGEIPPKTLKIIPQIVYCHLLNFAGMITYACGQSRPSSRSASVANPATAHRFHFFLNSHWRPYVV